MMTLLSAHCSPDSRVPLIQRLPVTMELEPEQKVGPYTATVAPPSTVSPAFVACPYTLLTHNALESRSFTSRGAPIKSNAPVLGSIGPLLPTSPDSPKSM